MDDNSSIVALRHHLRQTHNKNMLLFPTVIVKLSKHKIYFVQMCLYNQKVKD